jgi:tryptophan 2,3-dioxygenase
MSHKYTSVHYHDYLQLDKLLDAQTMRSKELGNPAHDEMLFIIVHQAYELWFKQIIHELESVRYDFMDNVVDETHIFTSVSRLDRITEIQQLLIKQIEIMETMTPLDFLDFRSYLFPASGFQSLQFRKIEVLLGLKDEQRITYNNKPYHTVFSDEAKEELDQIQKEGSLIVWLEKWLERTPFLDFPEFRFLEFYHDAVEKMHHREREAIQSSTYLEEESREARIKLLDKTAEYFEKILNKEYHDQLRKEGKWQLSYKATIAALLIKLYNEEPILHMPNLLLNKLMDVDELFTNWRYRHAQMVLRMLGRKTGTGGSSGYEYLKDTAKKHQIFTDLHGISTLLIPRSELPELPASLKKELGFYFSTK